MTERDANTAFARAVVDEWVRGGVTDACVAPGSRSTPMALALASDDRVGVHVFLDERSAAFAALGLGRATGRPAVVLCTSGTAAANFHPAVLEAHHARVPMIVATADRPAELHDVGAGQTLDQTHLYGRAVRWFVDLGAPADVVGAGAWWRATAARTVTAASGPVAGPVHWNLPFREPLVPTGEPLVDAPGRADGAPWTRSGVPLRAVPRDAVARVAALVRAHPRGVIVAGWGADADPALVARVSESCAWPVLAEPISRLRVGDAISTYDPLLRTPAFVATHRPDAVLRLGAPTSGRLGNEFVAGLPTVVVDPGDTWADPPRDAVEHIVADPDPFLRALAVTLDGGRADRSWLDDWLAVERTVRGALDAHLDATDVPFEGRIARDVVAAVPAGATLLVASSMPVRDVESFAAARDDVRIVANRGVNGIDGVVSTALGLALGGGPVVALLGDLCFLHDGNGLLGATTRGVDCTYVVVDNDGGGIFSFLPQAAAVPEHFEALFGTPHGIDVAALAAVHGVPVTEVTSAAALPDAVRASVATGGVRMVRVRTDRAANVDAHRAAWAAVVAALDATST
ncbi:MAG: 2-succinyl-5-enolpyruvyl-6-hydroxy-3-cyclohexene-1-carboxylic-acid synthase [Actinomycetes bacterium]